MMNNTHPICIRISEKLWKQYQIRYPHTFSTFVRRSLSKALTSREFFDSVYFSNSEVK